MPSKRRAPLRKIVETKLLHLTPTRVIEVLECGHEQRQKTDIFGPTNAVRRRCKQCSAASEGRGK